MYRTILAAALTAVVAACAPAPTTPGATAPVYRVDAAWPQALPEDNGVQLVFGQVAGIAVDDRNGHVWMVHRPASLLIDEWDRRGMPHEVAVLPCGHYSTGSAPFKFYDAYVLTKFLRKAL